jgi:hypothetical protein
MRPARSLITCVTSVGTTVLAAATSYGGEVIPQVLAQVNVTKGGGKNYVVESLVTVVLIGITLFVVCKSSRRV